MIVMDAEVCVFLAAEVEGETEAAAAPAGASVADVEDPSQLLDIDFDDGAFS